MTIFASSFEGCEPEDSKFGIRIIREGGKYSVYARARRYVKCHLSEFDMIVDEINTIPFGIHRIVRNKPAVALIHQLAKEIWFYETRFPMNVLGYFALEPFWLRGYRHFPTITVSASTRRDLLSLGFDHVQVVHNGIGITPLEKVPQKETSPVLIFVGRLVRSKLPEHAIAAFETVRATLPDAELWVIGDGYLREKLERNAVRGVSFFGRVTDEQKFNFLKKAHVLLAPSVREGWGISVLEANAMGTPAVGYRVPGLQDSIIDGDTGYLVQPLSHAALAESALKLFCGRGIKEQLSNNALKWSKLFSWDRAASEFSSILEERRVGINR